MATRVRLFGDKQMAQELAGYAALQEKLLLEGMKFQGLKQGKRSVRMLDGSIITVLSVFGQQTVDIHATRKEVLGVPLAEILELTRNLVATVTLKLPVLQLSSDAGIGYKTDIAMQLGGLVGGGSGSWLYTPGWETVGRNTALAGSVSTLRSFGGYLWSIHFDNKIVRIHPTTLVYNVYSLPVSVDGIITDIYPYNGYLYITTNYGEVCRATSAGSISLYKVLTYSDTYGGTSNYSLYGMRLMGSGGAPNLLIMGFASSSSSHTHAVFRKYSTYTIGSAVKSWTSPVSGTEYGPYLAGAEDGTYDWIIEPYGKTFRRSTSSSFVTFDSSTYSSGFDGAGELGGNTFGACSEAGQSGTSIIRRIGTGSWSRQIVLSDGLGGGGRYGQAYFYNFGTELWMTLPWSESGKTNAVYQLKTAAGSWVSHGSTVLAKITAAGDPANTFPIGMTYLSGYVYLMTYWGTLLKFG